MNFSHLFLSKATKETLKSFMDVKIEIIDRLSHKNFALEEGIALNLIEKGIKNLIFTNSKKLTQLIKENKITSKDFIINQIYKISRENIGSGDFHIYRGSLSGAGSALYEILKFTLDYFEKNKKFSKEQISEILNEVNEEIKFVG